MNPSSWQRARDVAEHVRDVRPFQRLRAEIAELANHPAVNDPLRALGVALLRYLDSVEEQIRVRALELGVAVLKHVKDRPPSRLEEAARPRRFAIFAAVAGGASYTAIAAELGISRGRAADVDHLLERRIHAAADRWQAARRTLPWNYPPQCGAASPWGDAQRCDREPGHDPLWHASRGVAWGA